MESQTTWAICPVADCVYALEYDPDENFFCPTCEMEMISACKRCGAPIQEEEPSSCAKCGVSLKE